MFSSQLGCVPAASGFKTWGGGAALAPILAGAALLSGCAGPGPSPAPEAAPEQPVASAMRSPEIGKAGFLPAPLVIRPLQADGGNITTDLAFLFEQQPAPGTLDRVGLILVAPSAVSMSSFEGNFNPGGEMVVLRGLGYAGDQNAVAVPTRPRVLRSRRAIATSQSRGANEPRVPIMLVGDYRLSGPGAEGDYFLNPGAGNSVPNPQLTFTVQVSVAGGIGASVDVPEGEFVIVSGDPAGGPGAITLSRPASIKGNSVASQMLAEIYTTMERAGIEKFR